MIPRSPVNSFWLSCALVLLTTTTAASLAVMYMVTTSPRHDKKKKPRLAVAFMGNSIQYFNDCPRLVESMLRKAGFAVEQNSCLRGGATLTSLWANGNGMRHKFSTPPALRKNGTYDIGSPSPSTLLQSKQHWDFVLFQDHTQHPARDATRQQSLETLRTHVVPILLQKQQSNPNLTVLFLQTFAYRVPGLKDSDDLGDFHAFTERLVDGYDQYAAALREAGIRNVQIVPMGRAVQWLYKHRRNDLWEAMYSWDDFHPSPHGTWLQACLIFVTLTQGRIPPPRYNALWWDYCRYMQPPNERPLPLPTAQEAEDLRQLAIVIYDMERSRETLGQSEAPETSCPENLK